MDNDAAAVRSALAFFRSVILSGEDWTPHCEEAYRAASIGVNNLATAARPPAMPIQPDTPWPRQ